MTIPKEFQYRNEEDFVQRLLVPLLHRLGFSIVVNYHGKREFGKDIVFGEIDRFGHVRYNALQAKYVPNISLSAIEEIVLDCKQAFLNPFVHPHTGSSEYIQAFYAVNGGTFSDEAATHFFNAVGLPFSACSRLLDAKSVMALDRWATLNRIEAVGSLLKGILVEIRYNRKIAAFVRPYIENYLQGTGTEIPTERLRTEASSDYITRPVLPRESLAQNMIQYWHDARRVNWDLDFAHINTEANRRTLLTHALKYLTELVRIDVSITAEVQEALNSLGTLVAI